MSEYNTVIKACHVVISVLCVVAVAAWARCCVHVRIEMCLGLLDRWLLLEMASTGGSEMSLASHDRLLEQKCWQRVSMTRQEDRIGQVVMEALASYML